MYVLIRAKSHFNVRIAKKSLITRQIDSNISGKRLRVKRQDQVNIMNSAPTSIIAHIDAKLMAVIKAIPIRVHYESMSEGEPEFDSTQK